MKRPLLPRLVARLRTASWLLAPALLLACGDGDVPAPPSAGCAADDFVGTVCAGAPLSICDGTACTDGVACQQVIDVSSDAALQSAAASAPGTCLALAPGKYGAVSLAPGVSLLGPGAGAVDVDGVLADGSAAPAVVRGLAVGAGGVVVSAGSVRVDSVVIHDAGSSAAPVNAAVVVVQGASADLFRVSIRDSARYGLFVDPGAALDVQASIVEGSEGPGVWASCTEGCDCDPLLRPQLSLTDSIVRDSRLAGVAVSAADVVLVNTDILRSKVGDAFHFGEGGGGLSVAACSNIDAETMRVSDNASFGILVDDSTAALGGPDTAQSLEVSGNLRGIWLQNIAASGPATAHVENVTLSGNSGVGLGFGGSEVGIIIICKTAVNDTQLALLPVFENAQDLGTSQSLGDGIEWLGGANAQLEQVSLSGSARASILIDGPATGSLLDVTLSGGDEAKGIVQQSYDGQGPQPTIVSNAPPITVTATEQHAVAKQPTAIGAL